MRSNSRGGDCRGGRNGGGSAIKLLTCAMAISILYGFEMPFAKVAHFAFMLAIAAVAAPGVMGGVLMASVGLVESILGFDAQHKATSGLWMMSPCLTV